MDAETRISITPKPAGTPVRLRAPDPEKDAVSLFNQINDPEVSNFLVITLPKNIEQFAQRLQDFCFDPAERLFVIAHEISGEALGVIRLHLHTRDAGEIIYWIGREHWGKGYAFEAIKQLKKFAFEELKLAFVLAYCYVGNSRSISVLDRSGFQITEAHRIAAGDATKGREACFRLTYATYVRGDAR